MPLVGVIAIQGDFEKHIRALESCGAQSIEVRSAEELERVDRAIIPGGESTTVGLLMKRFGLGDALRQKGAAGMPIWGTCMGMILMAHDLVDRDQYTLDLLDITIERNAFGAQVHSFEDEVQIRGLDEPVTGVFIRAPVVTRLGPGVASLGDYQGRVVAVRQGNLVGTSFHPELTDDTRMHKWFIDL
jgi:pyridoxal 5'-phosphate synthase pdxT subunit